MRLIGYCRQSTQRQFIENQGLDRYIEALKQYGCHEDNIYWDIESGANNNRKGLNIVLAEIRDRKFDCLVVPSQDRLTRDVEKWESIAKEFKELGITIVSLDRGEIDLETPAGSFSNTVLAAAAAMTRQINQYNSQQGHRYRRSQHKPLNASFGYRIKNDKLVINNHQYKDTEYTCYQVSRIIIDTFLRVQTTLGTLRHLLVLFGKDKAEKISDFPHDHSALIAWLKNPTMIGTLVYFPKKIGKRIEIPENHEPLVTKTEWIQIQNIIQRASFTRGSDLLRNPLAGKLFCECGHSMFVQNCGNRKYKSYLYVLCRGAYPKAGLNATCKHRTSHGLQIKDYINSVIELLITRSLEVSKWGLQDDSSPLENPKINELKAKITQLKAINDSELSDIIARKETELNLLIENKGYSQTFNQLVLDELLSNVVRRDFWENITPIELRNVFAELVDRVICDRGTLAITLKF